MSKTVTVSAESPTGRNEQFRKGNGHCMNRKEFVEGIRKGLYPDYHVRNINGTDTPVSNPDKTSRNNLG